jgi:TctA family transporter
MLGFILGPMLEENFRRSLLLSRGSFSIFVTRPIAGTLLGMIALFVAWQLFVFVRDARKGPLPKKHVEQAPVQTAPEGGS